MKDFTIFGISALLCVSVTPVTLNAHSNNGKSNALDANKATSALKEHSTLVNFNTNGLQITPFDSVAPAIDTHDGEIAYFDEIFYL